MHVPSKPMNQQSSFSLQPDGKLTVRSQGGDEQKTQWKIILGEWRYRVVCLSDMDDGLFMTCHLLTKRRIAYHK